VLVWWCNDRVTSQHCSLHRLIPSIPKRTVSSGWYGSSSTIFPFEHHRRFGDECRYLYRLGCMCVTRMSFSPTSAIYLYSCVHHIWNLECITVFRRQHTNCPFANNNNMPHSWHNAKRSPFILLSFRLNPSKIR
jgi:hypothetical protein